MSGQLSDFLAGHSRQAADLLTSKSSTPPVAGSDPRQFVNAVLVALSTDDLGPLLTYWGLEPFPLDRLPERLDAALQHLDALASVTTRLASDQGLALKAQLNLALATHTELAAVSRRLVMLCTERLADKLSNASSATTLRGTSLNITMHELRRPLTILNSYAQLLSAGMLGTLPESAGVAIEGITSSTEAMIRLVNALAELARLEDPDDMLAYENLSLGELVDGAVDAVAVEAELRGPSIRRDVEADVKVRGDRRRLVLALTNILSNALKHSPDGSEVDVKCWGDAAGAHFLVSDHGPGFPVEDTPRLFEKYFRSQGERERQIPGTGLGLYIVRTVAERHSGIVEARSVPGEGAEFEITIPLPRGNKRKR